MVTETFNLSTDQCKDIIKTVAYVYQTHKISNHFEPHQFLLTPAIVSRICGFTFSTEGRINQEIIYNKHTTLPFS